MRALVKVNLLNGLLEPEKYPDFVSWYKAETDRNPVRPKFVLGVNIQDLDTTPEGYNSPFLTMLIFPPELTHSEEAQKYGIWSLNSAGFVGCDGQSPLACRQSESLSLIYAHNFSANKIAQSILCEAFKIWPAQSEMIEVELPDPLTFSTPKERRVQRSAQGSGLSIKASEMGEMRDLAGRKRSWAARRMMKKKHKHD